MKARRRSDRSRQRAQSIPAAIESLVGNFAQELIARHGPAFDRDAQLKHRVAAQLRRSLPPQPRRSGRRGFEEVTAAIRLHGEIKRAHPEWRSKQIWSLIYRTLVPEWESLGVIERRTQADRLHRQVRWRLSARRRRARRRSESAPKRRAAHS